jgi:tetratricopeptide (TPR) repeat protein
VTEISRNVFHGPAPINTGSGPQHNSFTVLPAQRRERGAAGLPAEPAGFVGRSAQVDEILDVLRPGESADRAGRAGRPVVCAIGGLAGVGKSALAIHAARRAMASGWFHSGVWMSLRGFDPQAAPLGSGAAVPVLMRALGWDDELPPSPEEQLTVYHSVLAEMARSGRRILLVLDDVADAAQLDGLVPGEDVHRVLVTSRNSLASVRARLLDLDVLDVEEAVALLAGALTEARSGDPRAADERVLAELAEVCGRLPLGLQIAAALLKASPRRSVSSLATQLADERERLETLVFPDSTLRPGVRAALRVSCERLSDPQLRMLRLLAIDPGPDIGEDAVAALVGLPTHKAEALLYALETAYLVACDERGRWSMHSLVKLYARELLEDEPVDHAEARDRLLDHYLRVAQVAGEHMRALPGQPVPEEFSGREQALEWFDANQGSLIGAVHLAARSDRLDVAMNLPAALAEYLDWRRLFPAALEAHTAGLAAARALGNRRGERRALNELGLALRDLRRFEEAAENHRCDLEICREIGDRKREASALTNLGLVLGDLRRFEEAADAHRQAVAAFREIGERRLEGRAFGNLGLALRDLWRLDEAVDAYRQNLEVCREFVDRHGEAIMLNNLGIALSALDRAAEATDALRESVAAYRETRDVHGEGLALGNLGGALRETGLLEDSARTLLQAAEIMRGQRDRNGEGRVTLNLALTLATARRFEEAMERNREAATIFLETGDLHGAGSALHGLAILLREAGRFEESVAVHRETITCYQGTEDRRSEAMALVGLSLSLRKAGRPEEADAAFRQGAAMLELYPDQHAT